MGARKITYTRFFIIELFIDEWHNNEHNEPNFNLNVMNRQFILDL